MSGTTVSLSGAVKAAENVKPRELPYIPAETFEVFDLPGTGFLGRSRKRSDEQVIGYQHGEAQRSVPLAVVAAAIQSGAIPAAEVRALLPQEGKGK